MNELEKARCELNEIDRQMTVLFESRMRQVERVIAYKKKHCLQILDIAREQEVLRKNRSYLENANYVKYYEQFMTYVMQLSKEYQEELCDDHMASDRK